MLRRLKPDEIPPPSVATLVAAVPRTPEHETLAAEIAGLEAEREEMLSRQRELIAGNLSGTDQNAARGIRALEKKRVALQEKLFPLRVQLRAHRAEHVQAVQAALRQDVAEVARGILACLAQLNAAMGWVNAYEHELHRLGGEPVFMNLPLGNIELRARVLAGIEGQLAGEGLACS